MTLLPGPVQTKKGLPHCKYTQSLSLSLPLTKWIPWFLVTPLGCDFRSFDRPLNDKYHFDVVIIVANSTSSLSGRRTWGLFFLRWQSNQLNFANGFTSLEGLFFWDRFGSLGFPLFFWSKMISFFWVSAISPFVRKGLAQLLGTLSFKMQLKISLFDSLGFSSVGRWLFFKSYPLLDI